MKILHRIIELLRLNHGIPEAHWKGEKLIMCFKCSCGRLQNCFDATNDPALDPIGNKTRECKICHKVYSEQGFWSHIGRYHKDYSEV